MKLLPASPWDFLTATARDGKVRFDARKGFEAGAFLVSTWGFVFLILADRMSEFYFVGYLATWTAARFLRDREKRLANGGAISLPPADFSGGFIAPMCDTFGST